MVIKKLSTLSKLESQSIGEYLERLSFSDEYASEEDRSKLLETINLLKSPILMLNITEKIKENLAFIFGDDEEFTMFSDWVSSVYPVVNVDRLRKDIQRDGESVNQFKLF
jgi:hypothetical protein